MYGYGVSDEQAKCAYNVNCDDVYYLLLAENNNNNKQKLEYPSTCITKTKAVLNILTQMYNILKQI